MNRARAHVLLVNADDAARAATRAVLVHAGVTAIDEARGAADALQRFATGRYDVLVVALDPPRLDAARLLAAVRRAPEGADTPVLMQTGVVYAEQIAALLEAGANGVAYTPQALVHKVTRLLATVAPVELQPAELGLTEPEQRRRG